MPLAGLRDREQPRIEAHVLEHLRGHREHVAPQEDHEHRRAGEELERRLVRSRRLDASRTPRSPPARPCRGAVRGARRAKRPRMSMPNCAGSRLLARDHLRRRAKERLRIAIEIDGSGVADQESLAVAVRRERIVVRSVHHRDGLRAQPRDSAQRAPCAPAPCSPPRAPRAQCIRARSARRDDTRSGSRCSRGATAADSTDRACPSRTEVPSPRTRCAPLRGSCAEARR